MPQLPHSHWIISSRIHWLVRMDKKSFQTPYVTCKLINGFWKLFSLSKSLQKDFESFFRFKILVWLVTRATQSIIDVPLQVNRFQKNISRIVQYKYSASCSGDFILQNLILRTRSCGTGLITQSSWVFHFRQTTLVWSKCFVPHLYQFRRGISEGSALKYFYMIRRGGRSSFRNDLCSQFCSEMTFATEYKLSSMMCFVGILTSLLATEFIQVVKYVAKCRLLQNWLLRNDDADLWEFPQRVAAHVWGGFGQ